MYCLERQDKFPGKVWLEWRGPYDVISKLSPLNFVIQSGDDKRVAFVQQLKLFV